MDSLPHPQRANRPSSGLPAIVLILILFAGGFVGLRELNVILRDDAAFAQAQAAGPLGLREYLFDARNKNHRGEAAALLDKAFDRAIANLLSKPEAVKPRTEGFVALLNQIRKTDKCLLAVCVKEIPNPQLPVEIVDPAAAAGREAEVCQKIENKIVTALEPAGLVGLYETREEERSHIDFTWKFLPVEKAPGTLRIQWSLTLRGEVGGKPVFDTVEVFRDAQPGPNPANSVLNSCLDEVFRGMLGFTVEPPVQAIDEG